MSNLLSKDELKKLKKFLNTIDIDSYDFSSEEINYHKVAKAVKASPLYAQIPHKNDDIIASIKTNANGEFTYNDHGKNTVTTSHYHSMILLASKASNSKQKLNKKWLSLMMSNIEALLKSIFNFKQKGRKVKNDLLNKINNIDSFYIDLRKQIMAIEGQYDNDLFEYLLLLPDLFVYLLKLMANDNVPVSYKARLLSVIIYILSPVDVIPEGILGAFGFIDDVYLSIRLVMDLLLINDISKEMMVALWPGKLSTINNMTTIYEDIKALLDNPLMSLIDGFYKRIVGRFTKN